MHRPMVFQLHALVRELLSFQARMQESLQRQPRLLQSAQSEVFSPLSRVSGSVRCSYILPCFPERA